MLPLRVEGVEGEGVGWLEGDCYNCERKHVCKITTEISFF